MSQSKGPHFSDVLLKAGKRKWLNCIQLLGTPQTVAHQAPHSSEFSRPDTGVGCHFLFQGIFLTQRQPRSPTLKADSFLFEPWGKPIKSRGWGANRGRGQWETHRSQATTDLGILVEILMSTFLLDFQRYLFLTGVNTKDQRPQSFYAPSLRPHFWDIHRWGEG